jgi:hypothetical protein
MSDFDKAVAEYKKRGTPVRFIEKLKMTNKKKSDLLKRVMMHVKGCLPKFDPFYVKPKKKTGGRKKK